MARTLGVWHQTNHVSSLVADAGDVADRTVWVRGVGQHDLVIGL